MLLSATWNTQQANSSRYRVHQHVAVVVALQITSWLTHHISVTTGDLSKLEKNIVLRGHLESVCEYTYLHFGFLGPRHSEWQRVSSGMRLGE